MFLYNSINIAERINLLLKDNQLSQKEMLKQCKLNKNAVSSMIYRGSMPKVDSIAKIADYLNTSIDYLLGRTDDPAFNPTKKD